jgi:hypothetical protein
MKPKVKIVVKKSNNQLLVDPPKFTANNVELKDLNNITTDKIAFAVKQIKNNYSFFNQ